MNACILSLVFVFAAAQAAAPKRPADSPDAAAKASAATGPSCGEVPEGNPFEEPGPRPGDQGDCASWTTRYSRKFATKADKTLDCGRLLLEGKTRCESHACKEEKSIPVAKAPKGGDCSCTEWRLAGEQTCSRKDDKGVCLEWLGNCKKEGDRVVCEVSTTTCVAMHCHKPHKKGK